jgi:hypothetical protein
MLAWLLPLTERLARYGRLVRRHYLLLLKTAITLVVIRLTLSTRGYRPILRHIGRVMPRADRSIQLELLAWAVERVAPAVPNATCMTQALALRYLAAREGQPCTIRIGVKQEPGKPFEAHAWVIADDKVIIGGRDEIIATFNPIVDL